MQQNNIQYQKEGKLNQKKFYNNGKQIKSLYSLRDCLPNYNLNDNFDSRSNSTVYSTSTVSRTPQTFIKNQKSFFPTKSQQSGASPLQQSLGMAQISKSNYFQSKYLHNSSDNIQHLLMRTDRKLNQEYLNFPPLKIDNNKLLDENDGDRRLTLRTLNEAKIKKHSLDDVSSVQGQQLGQKNFLVGQDSILSSDRERYLFRMGSSPPQEKDDGSKEQSPNYLENEHFQFDKNKYMTFSQLSKKNIIQDMKNNFQGDGQQNTMKCSSKYLSSDQLLKKIEENSNQKQELIQLNKSDIQSDLLSSKQNRLKEFTNNNSQILEQYLHYLGDQFNEIYFRAKMKNKHRELANQKLQQFMSELKYMNDIENSQQIKGKMQKGLNKIKIMKQLAHIEKKTQAEIQQHIKNYQPKKKNQTTRSPSPIQPCSPIKISQQQLQVQQLNNNTSIEKGTLQQINSQLLISQKLLEEGSIQNIGKKMSPSEQSHTMLNNLKKTEKGQVSKQQSTIYRIKQQQIQLKKKDTKKIRKQTENDEEDYIDYKIIQDLCDNMNKLIKIKGNIIHSVNKLKVINGFNEKIKSILYDGDTLKDFYNIRFIQSKITAETDKKAIIQIIKKIQYFNKSLEEYLLSKDRDIESDIKEGLIKETETISKKCFNLLYKEQPSKRKQELIEISQGRSPKPNFHNYTKIANQLERVETRLQTKFENVSNINRIECNHIVRIMQVYQYI